MGLFAFVLLTGYGLIQITKRFLRTGDWVSLSILAGLIGFLTVGVVDSLFDAPRLSLAFFLVLLVGCLPADIIRIGQRKHRAVPGVDEVKPDEARVAAPLGVALSPAGKQPFVWRDLGLSVGVFAMLGLAVTHLPGVPYNVREMIYQGSPILSALFLSLFWFCLAGMPMVFARALAASHGFRLLYLPATLLHAAAAAVLVITAAPSESIHDVVGSPVLAWPGQLESFARLTALFAALSLLLTGGAWLAKFALRKRREGGILAWCLCAAILLTLAHWVVVERAATDNLTELMTAGGGVQTSVALSLCILLLGVGGSLLAMYAGGVGLSRRATLFWVMLTVPLSYGLLAIGLEAQLMKYGQHFSALQFLLSADREHLVSGTELVMRFGLAACAGLLALAFAQWPFLRLATGAAAARGHTATFPH